MATSIISVSCDSSEESVGSSTSRVVMFGIIPTVIPVVSEVAAIVASPAGILDLEIYTTSETDPFEDLSSPVHAPAAHIISSFLHSSDSSEASDNPFGSDSFVSHLSLDSHEIVPAPPGVHRRPTILVLPGQEIPLCRPYRTYPDGVLRMLTARKRVHPFLARIPANRRRFHSSSSLPPRKRHRATPYSSSSNLPSSTTTVAPANVPGLATKDTPVTTVDHSPTPSSSVGPSRKRCRSPATSIPLAIPTPGVVSSARADLLPPLKRIGGPSATLSSEDGSEGSMEVGSKEHIDSNVMADIEADIAAEATTTDEIRAKTEVGFEGDDKAEDEAESSARGTIKIGVDIVSEPKIIADSLVPASDKGSRENFKIELDVVIQLFL
ncbi:hypothetical protein Tco_1070318 [Tanacetum coccineum]|uniref:Uncharacterized protein n=1 Tax=Tanacetum coccineum TaxID=301880 RepID=A0ABQ5HMF9_9ASTR